jgi:hypothetical protein
MILTNICESYVQMGLVYQFNTLDSNNINYRSKSMLSTHSISQPCGISGCETVSSKCCQRRMIALVGILSFPYLARVACDSRANLALTRSAATKNQSCGRPNSLPRILQIDSCELFTRSIVMTFIMGALATVDAR